MRDSVDRYLSLAAFLSLTCLLIPGCQAFSFDDYGKPFHGDGTYYGFTTGGNCAMRGELPAMYSSMLPVAMNKEQYANSASCGACLVVRGSGRGSGANPIIGPIRAYVHDQCPECKKGDVDLSKSGDGRWDISWEFVECPSVQPSFLFEGSNRYYKKLQIRGLAVPARSMVIDGVRGSKTQDNFFVAHKGSGFRSSGKVEIEDMKGVKMTAEMRLDVSDGVVKADKISPPPGGARPSPSRRPRRTPTPRPGSGRCVPNWRVCGEGRRNIWNTDKCCNSNYECRFVSGGEKKCAPKKSVGRCLGQYQWCSGPWNRSGTTVCCSGYTCQNHRGHRYKRCI